MCLQGSSHPQSAVGGVDGKGEDGPEMLPDRAAWDQLAGEGELGVRRDRR